MDVVLLTDVCAVDPDDMLAFLYLISQHKKKKVNIKAVIGAHFFTDYRARIIRHILNECGLNDVFVVEGTGLKYDDPNPNREEFLKANPLFPTAIFGVPKNIKKEDERQWFPDFGKAYGDIDSLPKSNIVLQSESIKFLSDLIGGYSPQHKLKVLAISPFHDLAQIDEKLYQCMDLYAMGGGRDDLIDFKGFCSSDEKSVDLLGGYNWGIAPKVTSVVLEKLIRTNTRMTLISSGFVRTEKWILDKETSAKWQMLPANELVQMIIKDFLDCSKSDKLIRESLLCDPLTVLIGLSGSIGYKTIGVNISIADNFKDFDVPNKFQYLDKTLSFIKVSKELPINVNYVSAVSHDKQNLILDIEHLLF